MKLTLEPTARIVHLDGLPCRVWQGADEHGTPVHAFVTRVAVSVDDLEAHERFAAALVESATPRPDVAAIPARLWLD